MLFRKIFLFLPLTLFCSQIFGQNEISNIYTTKEYKIQFPYTPEKMTQPLPTTLGELLMTILSCEPKSTAMDENYVYLLMETDYPEMEVHSDKTDILEKFFRGSVDGAVVNVKGKLIKETVGKVSQYPSRTIEIDYGNGIAIIKMKMILKESKMIIIQTITETKKYPNKAIDAFFDSFLIK